MKASDPFIAELGSNLRVRCHRFGVPTGDSRFGSYSRMTIAIDSIGLYPKRTSIIHPGRVCVKHFKTAWAPKWDYSTSPCPTTTYRTVPEVI